MEKTTFGAWCFWGIEYSFSKVPGVLEAPVGYSGGSLENPTYQQVCSGQTGHAEVVQVKFDPNKVSFQELLEVFWNIHDPTTLNRQGPDVGTQYRSAILFHSQEQETLARKSVQNLTEQKKYSNPIVTEISPIDVFYLWEEYHQRYFEKQGRH